MRRLDDASNDIPHNHHSNGRTGPGSKINPTIGVRTTHPDFVRRLDRILGEGAIIGQLGVGLGDVPQPGTVSHDQYAPERINEGRIAHGGSVYPMTSSFHNAPLQSQFRRGCIPKNVAKTPTPRHRRWTAATGTSKTSFFALQRILAPLFSAVWREKFNRATGNGMHPSADTAANTNSVLAANAIGAHLPSPRILLSWRVR